jgi:hypothetical protein
MTNQHRATPEQWETIEQWAASSAAAACILELHARIEALEAAQPKVRSGPESPLVERVADAIAAADDEGLTNMTWSNHSRAAILEVAAWFRTERDSPETAAALEQEASR